MGGVASMSKFREQREIKAQRRNRLRSLMHQFMDAAEKSDEDAMKMIGRGLSAYTQDEINAANRSVSRERMKPKDPA